MQLIFKKSRKKEGPLKTGGTISIALTVYIGGCTEIREIRSIVY